MLPQIGVLDQFVEVTVPPAPPERPQTLRETALLLPGDRAAAVALRWGRRNRCATAGR